MPAHEPVLSICVPSRNRQPYFKQTVQALLRSARQDVEFVFVDNSDQPEIMDDFMRSLLGDPRIRYVTSGAKTRSMLENWNMAMEASTGRWVTFIGDDDYADPDAAGVILKIEAERPGVEAIDWAKLFYTWPDGDKPASGQIVQTLTAVHDVSHDLIKDRAYRFRQASNIIVSGFSIYHGAASRKLIDRIKARYGGAFFEFPVVDYESLYKIIANAKSFVHCARPLSVLGVCPMSNTAGIKSLKDQEAKQALFDRELDAPLDEMACFKDYPFKSRFGLMACIGMVHHWFSKRHGVAFSGFEENFVQACMNQCAAAASADDFEVTAARYRSAFSKWKGGKYLRQFKPVYPERPANLPPFAGLTPEKLLVVNADNPHCRTCEDYYRFVSGALLPVSEIVADFQFVVDEKAKKRA